MKKHILKILACLMLIANFPVKASATDISEDFEIDFIDKNSTTIVKSHCIEIGETKYTLGEKVVSSFWNTEEGRNQLAENVPSRLFSSILNFWDFSIIPVRSSRQLARLSKSAEPTEVTIEEYTELDTLNRDKASFFIIKKVQIDGTYYTLGEPKEVSYENSLHDRQKLQEEIQEPFYSLVMAVWGDSPTVIPDEPERQLQLQSAKQTEHEPELRLQSE